MLSVYIKLPFFYLSGLSFASFLFLIGLFGILWNQKNIIIVFLCVELMLFGSGLQFIFYSLVFKYSLGQIFALLILTIATAETAIGLGIIILAYRLNRSVSFKTFAILRS
jgi:NADH:ubiquinone oxidoreductase subunit K